MISAFCLIFALTLENVMAAAAQNTGWTRLENGTWAYMREGEQEYLRDSWLELDGAQYHFDTAGRMDTGWQWIEGNWYFFRPFSDETEGRSITGWQWIDGKCYCFSETAAEKNHAGAMYADCVTPDGYRVGISGAWIGENGLEIVIPGKGILTERMGEKGEIGEKKEVSGLGGRGHGKGSGGGNGDAGSGKENGDGDAGRGKGNGDGDAGSGKGNGDGDAGSGKGNGNGDADSGKESGNGDAGSGKESGDDDTDSGKSKGEQKREEEPGDKSEEESGNQPGKETVKPPEEGESEEHSSGEPENQPGDPAEVPGTHSNNPELPSVSENEPVKDSMASPSEARRVRWEVRFVEQGKHENQIFRSQQGETEEGGKLSIDFPEKFVGTDGYEYCSVDPSPKVIAVSGNGLQKYFIEFIRGDRKQPEENSEAETARLRLDKWLEAAQAADLEITGRMSGRNQIITVDRNESNKRMKNLVSMVQDGEYHEIYLIARNHVPPSLVISEAFSTVTDISVLLMDEFSVSQDWYSVTRIRFKKVWSVDTCSHEMETEELLMPGCEESGHKKLLCRRCGFAEEILLPALGHQDSDKDGFCDICGKKAAETVIPEPMYFHVGDVQLRTIGDKQYRFRCIDEDYHDSRDNSQSSALFLCDTVLRSDIDSDSSQKVKMDFGLDNNYKTSNIRKWLNSNARAGLFDGQTSYTGINTACVGSTSAGSWEQFEPWEISEIERPFQLMEDKLFILSAEEAFTYREYLWKFSGSGENNPQTQLSPYSKGYYLRTPQYAGEEKFEYGRGIYAVDLVNGNIHPVDVSNTSIGIRPVMTIRQSAAGKLPG